MSDVAASLRTYGTIQFGLEQMNAAARKQLTRALANEPGQRNPRARRR